MRTPKFRMRKKDVKIINLLRENSRMSLTTLSRKVGQPVSTLHERVRRMVQSGVAKFTLVLSPKYRKAYYEMDTSNFTCDHGRTELDPETDERVCLDCGGSVWR